MATSKLRNYDNVHPYMRDYKWKSGDLCYWRNSNIYSQETKKKLEQRMIEMVDWNQDYEKNKNQL